MASFTDNFFSNTKITNKSNKTSKKKKDDEDESYTSFTESFFDNSYDEYYKSDGRSQYASYDDDNTVYSEEFINEYNSFIDRMNKGAKERYDEQVAKTESATMYYSANKNKLIEEVLETFEIKRSLSKKGCPYDNAVAEAAFKVIKTEFAFNKVFGSLEELQMELFDYVNWYNNHRIHGSLNYKTPVECRPE